MHERLYQENHKMLLYWALRYRQACAQRADLDIEDLVQAGFFGLVEAQKTYQEEQGSWFAWASLHIRNTMREALGMRGKKQIYAMSLDAPISDTDGEQTENSLLDSIVDESIKPFDAKIINDELCAAIRSALEAISEDKVRLAVQWIHLEGKNKEDTARDLEVKPEAVPGLLRRGYTTMRRNKRLQKEVPGLDEVTRFHAHKSFKAFMRDRTSVVEASVLWRESHREEYEPR